MTRLLSKLLFVTGAFLFVLAAYAYLTADGAGARIEDADREFPGLTVGVNKVSYQLHNPTRHTVRVLGCSFC
ncbi:MAG TPA: hypothetical protein VFE62_25410 [Gemmataceae bacterium]|nr:hypothetical protein [Gemmataceae bacterium]